MIRIRDMHFAYKATGFSLRVPELNVACGEHVAIIGPSGSGKTTLVNLICGIFRPQSGKVTVDGEVLSDQSDGLRRRFRISRIGMVFQEFELLEYLTVRENILLPYLINGALKLDGRVRDLADHLAESVGLADKLKRHPRALSQGERQRVVVCRAMLPQPKLLVADEPTGNLDTGTAEQILNLLFQQIAEAAGTLLMVTHNTSLLDRFDQVVDVDRFTEGVKQ